MEKKICSKCKIEKDICFFNKKSKNKKGIQFFKSRCKSCQSEDEKIKRQTNKDKYKLWYEKNRDARNHWRSIYYQKNKERILEYNQKYNVQKQISRRKKYNEDPLYKLKNKLSNRLRKILKLKSLEKKKSFINVLGCSLEFLKEYIEKKFKVGMSWENHSFDGWHIDHIVPLSSAKTEEEVYKLCHYTNLQPLWAEENLKKSNKILI